MTSPPHDLLLLATSLAQLKNQARVITLFSEGINTIFPGLGLRWADDAAPEQQNQVEVCTRNERFGFLVYAGETQPDELTRALIHNASQMLGVILENLRQEQLLLEQKQALEVLAEERARLAEKLEVRVAQRTADLEHANQSLDNSRLAALNMMEDALEARRHAEETAASLQREIAERQQAQETLSQERRLLRAVLDNLPVAVYVKDQQGRKTLSNRVDLDLIGLPETEVLGKTDAEVFPPEIAARFWADDQMVLNSGASVRNREELSLNRRQGKEFWQLTSKVPLYNTDGEVTGLVGIGLDITDRKRTEEVLRLRESYLTSIIENQPGLVWLKDAESRFLAVNRRFAKSCGLDRPELLAGKTDRDIWPAELAEQYRADDLAVIQAKTSVIVEEPICDGGVTKWFETFKNPVVDEKGEVIGTTGFARDVTDRKQAEAALRESETKFRAILENSVDAIGVLTMDRHVFVNPAYLQLFGYTSDGELIGRSILDLIAPEEYEKVIQNVHRDSEADTAPLFYETRGRRKDGTQFEMDVHVSNYALHDELYTLVILRDITERKRRERELEAIAALSAALRDAPGRADMLPVIVEQIVDLLNCVAVTVELLDPPTGETIVEAAHGLWQPLTGMHQPPDTGLNAVISQTQKPYHLHDFNETLPTAYPVWARQGIRDVVGAPLIAQEDLIGFIWIGRKANIDETEIGLLTSIADIAANALQRATLYEQTQQDAAELEQRVAARTAELARERERLRAILDTAGEGVVFTDLQGTIEYINPAMEQLTGYTLDEAQGQNSRLWQSGQTRRSVYTELWGMITQGRTWQGELINRRRDGTLYDAALTISPLTDPDRPIAGYVGVVRDITRQKELDRLKDQFVSNVSHELRTPLTNIILNLQLLERGSPDKRAQYQATLRREAERLKGMIEDLLDLSRLDRQTAPMQLAPLNLHELLGPLVADRMTQAAERGLTLEFLPTAPVAQVLAEASVLTQVVSNLLTNALNYTPAGGSVTVQTYPQRALAQNWITLTVRDSGPGIAAHELPHLFDRFYRGEVGRRAKAPGTGLGLAITKAILDQLGGRITVESQPGYGAAFTVWLKPA